MLSRAFPPPAAWALATAVAGTLDLAYACVVNGSKGVPPERVFQSIASGLLGRGAFQGGAATAPLGIALHFAILAIAVQVFWQARGRIGGGQGRWVVAGLLAGVVIYAVMNAVVVPLSAAPFRTMHTPAQVARDLAAHMLLVGLPIAWFCLRSAR
jgi:hypothetical protein